MIHNDSNRDSDRDSVHSNWSKLMTVKSGMNINASMSNASLEAMKISAQPRKRAIKNIVLVPYKPKPKDWGSWKIKSPYVTRTIASPFLISNKQNQNNERAYVPRSPYYSPVHPLEFYGDD